MFKLTILHTNDTHSYLDDFAKRANIINTIRKHNRDIENAATLLVDAGDVLSGSIYFNMYQGEKEAQLLNTLDYDMMAFGNHEFDCGSAFLAQFIKRLHFPIIASNLDFSNDPVLAPFQNKHDDSPILPYIIKEYGNGIKVGIFALLTETTQESATPSKETIFHDAFSKAQEMVGFFHNLGIKNIILLSHLGVDEDIKLAEKQVGINLIIGAHTHTVLEKALIVTCQDHQTAIVQTGKYGQHLGEVQIMFNQDGEISSITNMLHDITHHHSEDLKVKAIIDEIQLARQKYSETTIATIKKKINGERAQDKFSENALSHIVADAYYYEAEAQGFKPDIGIINGGGVRASLYAGHITYADLINVLPFNKSLTILEVTGLQLKDSLQHGLIPQISHLEVIYNDENEIIEMFLLRDNGSSWPIEDHRKYRIATNQFVGYGKDNYIGFSKDDIIAQDLELDINILQKYITALPQPVDVSFKSRFIFK